MKKTILRIFATVIILALALSACDSSTLNEVSQHPLSEPSAALLQTQTPVPQELESTVPTVTQESTSTPEPTLSPDPVTSPEPTQTPEPATPESTVTPAPSLTPEPAAPVQSPTTEPTPTPAPTFAPTQKPQPVNTTGKPDYYLQLPDRLIPSDLFSLFPYLEDKGYMPDFRGLDVDECSTILAEFDIENYSYEYESSEFIPEGYVIRQSLPSMLDLEKPINRKLIIYISTGPVEENHKEFLTLCENKNWPVESWPYIISSAKKIIDNLNYEKAKLINALQNNVDSVVMLSETESAMAEYKGYYNTNTHEIGFGNFYADESTFIHEILHAVSYEQESGKIGLGLTTSNYRYATEAYTDYLADKGSFIYQWYALEFQKGYREVLITSDVHQCNGVYNFYLQLHSSFFQLVGEDNLKKAFFGAASALQEVMNDFDRRFGSGKWNSLMDKADEICRIASTVRVDIALGRQDLITAYFDEVLECLNMILTECDDFESYNQLYKLIRQIQGSFPLEFNNYRDKLYSLRAVDVMKKINEIDSEFSYNEDPDKWFIGDRFGLSLTELFSRAINQGNAEAIYISDIKMCGSNGSFNNYSFFYKTDTNVSSWVSPSLEKYLDTKLYVKFDISGLSDQFICNWYITENLVSKFEGVKINFDDISKSSIFNYLESKNVLYEIEYIDIVGLPTAKNGMLVKQFPESGVAVKENEGKILLTFLRNKDD